MQNKTNQKEKIVIIFNGLDDFVGMKKIAKRRGDEKQASLYQKHIDKILKRLSI